MPATTTRPEDHLAITDGDLSVEGLDAAVRIVRDRWGIPHIEAGSAHDAFFAQGYCIAQDRLFQLEQRRQMARGTAARFLNGGLLRSDIANRRAGFVRHAQSEWEAQSDDARMILDAYSAGVNAALATQRRPYEFELLEWEMEPWSPVDTLAIMKMVASGNEWSATLRRAKVAEALGADAVLRLLPDIGPGSVMITPSGQRWTQDEHPFAAAIAEGMEEPEGSVAAGGGSNCWVIHGSRTTTGAPIVCGDPHLNVRIPAEWHVMHMQCPEFTVAGPCTPGAPGPIYYGHNTSVAWTMTHAGGDRYDVYREKIRQGDGGPEALFRGEREPLTRRDERFEVRDDETVVETIWETRHGPVVMGDPTQDDEVATARWGLVEPGHDFDALIEIYSARSIAQVREGFRTYDSISGNFCFADQNGDIGYQYTGRIPKRPAWVLPVPGWDGEHEWDGSIAKDELPTDENPSVGYIATANNKTTAPDYPYYLSTAGTPWRADRLRELFAEREVFSPDDMPAMQGDLQSIPARELSRRYASFEASDADARAMQDLLRGWDAVVDVESTAAIVYMETTELLSQATVHRFYDAVPGNATTPLIEGRATLLRELRRDDRALLGGFASWDLAIEDALRKAAAALREKFGEDSSRWRWGDAHWMTFRHNMGREEALADILNLPNVEVGGDGATLWATQARYGIGSDHGVSYRQLFDLSDLNAARICIPPGNSGQPGSPHFGDNIERWRTLDYHPLFIDWSDIEANAEAELRLSPA